MAYQLLTAYNLDQAVGPGAPNQAADVALVRFFLRRLADANALPEAKGLAINGDWGADLEAAIRSFQAEVVKHGHSCARDGRVDPAQHIGQGIRSDITHTQYTIMHLNASYRRRFETLHNDITKDPNCPAVLKTALVQHSHGAFGW